MSMEILQPPGWPRPKGYSNGVAASGRMVFVAGQIGWDEKGDLAAPDMLGQFKKTLENTLAVLAEAGAGAENVVRMTWYLTDRAEYLGAAREFGAVWRQLMGRHYPAMAVVEVAGLMEPGARIEIETTAVVPE